ncbi:SAM-dependent methyltransferase [Streptomyces nodosus]|uniref:SAM-dependent methyltransferase n=1 Tax=Streptomyces nodosus TaxID=40318 RepID=UPI003829FDE5
MFVPLYEAVYERLAVGPGTRLLGLGCGAGLALLMAATRGASVTGVESRAGARAALARERLRPGAWGGRPPGDIRIVEGSPRDATPPPGRPAYTLLTAFEPLGYGTGATAAPTEQLAAAVPFAADGAAVVLSGWAPPERCGASAVLRIATGAADPPRGAGGWRPPRGDELEETARRCGLRPTGAGRVACPFGYADPDSAIRGMLSTGFLDAAIGATDEEQVRKELAEALHPYRRADGTVWVPNTFRYLIARVPRTRVPEDGPAYAEGAPAERDALGVHAVRSGRHRPDRAGVSP